MFAALRKARPAAWPILALTLLGVLGNAFPLPVFFGVDYLFGSIAVLLATVLYGPAVGFGISLLTASQTILLWHHPYGAIPLLLEAGFVGLAIGRLRANLALAGMLFWVLVGLPLVYLLYRFALGMEHADALLAALKQTSNGIVNAVVASLLIACVPVLRAAQGQRDPRLTLFETIFNSFLAAALIPIFAILTFDARRAVGDVERDAKASLTALSSRLTITVDRWREDHSRAISMLADFVEHHRPLTPAVAQHMLAAHRRAWPNFYGAFICDENGITTAFEPPVNARGQSTLGIDFSDRPYFQKMKAGAKEPDVSGVFQARGGVFVPVSNITAPVRINGRFAGIVSGSVNLGDLGKLLGKVSSRFAYEATIVDGVGRVVASSSETLKPLEEFPNFKALTDDDEQPNSYRRWPEAKMSPMTRWKKSWLGLSATMPGPGNWTLVVEAPLRQHQDLLYGRYSEVLTLFIGLTIALLLASSWVAGLIARPLIQLSQETKNVPAKMGENLKVRWPTSRLLEVNLLVENFRRAYEALRHRFDELESSRAQLDRANRTKDEFLWIASHELKTPLTPVKLQLQLLKKLLRKGVLDRERVERSFVIAERQIDRLARLVDDLLDVSRIDSGKLRLNLEPVDLTELVNEVVEQYRPQLLDAGCTIHLSAAEKLEIAADPARIEQVLVNLLTNAAKYAPQSDVEIVIEKKDKVAALKVADHGPGIPPEATGKIFDRFERAHSTKHVTGLGLGLFITRKIVEAHGGEIAVDSEVGRGTEFTATLPLA